MKLSSKRSYLTERKKNKVIKFISEGFSYREAAKLTGCCFTSINRWALSDKSFKKRLDNARAFSAKRLLEHGINELAKGATQVEEKIEVFTKDEETGEYTKKSTKVTKLPPNVHALKLIASKYDNTYKDNNVSEVNITITQKDRALSIEERLAILSKDSIEGETIELEASDYGEL